MAGLTKQTANEPHTFERLKSTLRVLFDGLDMISTGELRIYASSPFLSTHARPLRDQRRVWMQNHYAMQNAI